MKKLQILFAAAVVAMGSFSAFAADWVYDAATKTVSDGVWTFSATADTSKKTIVFNTCWGFPEELSTLDLSKPISDGSVSLTLTELGNMFGNGGNYWKDLHETTNGMTLAEVVFPKTGLTKIGDGAFCNCTALTNCINFLPDSVTAIGSACFHGVMTHSDLYLNGITGNTINRHPFTSSGLASVHFGPNVGAVGSGSNTQSGFQYASFITNVTFSILGSGVEITKDGMQVGSNDYPGFPLVLNGVKIVGESGFQNIRTSSVVFDYCIDNINRTNPFLSSFCTKFTFRGLPPTSLSILYSAKNLDVTTYVRSRFAKEWSEYAEGGVIAEEGTSFRTDLISDEKITKKRPLLLLPVEEIATPQEFVEKITADPDGEFKLTADIDFTGTGYASIPLFIGVLDGQGHTITGVGAQPLFEIVHGIVENLTLDGTVAGANTVISYPSAGVRGALCNTNAAGTVSGVVVRGYTMKATGYKDCYVGAFAGIALNEAKFIGCTADASVNVSVAQDSYGGGLVGGFAMTGGTALREGLMIACTNEASVSFSAYCSNVSSGSGVGGILGRAMDLGSQKLTIRACINNAALVNSSEKNGTFGGILGTGSGSGEDNFVIADCVNNGLLSVHHWKGGATIGGIVGTGVTLTISNCVNYANITNDLGKIGRCGGLMGSLGTIPKSNNIGKILDSANYGNIYTETDADASYAGGLIARGQLNKDYGPAFYIKNCANYGELRGTYVAEVCPLLWDEKKVYVGSKTFPSYKVENCFFMTKQLHYPWPDTNSWFTEGDGLITAADEGFDAKVAAKTLSAGAAELGLGAWCRGKVNGKVLPELTALSRDPVRPGLMLLVR